MQSGKQVEELTVFPLQLMRERDVAACEASKSVGYIKIQVGEWAESTPGEAKKVECPRFLLHGTSVASALQIVKDRGLNANPGICGVGAYGFRVQDDSLESLLGQAQLLVVKTTTTDHPLT